MATTPDDKPSKPSSPATGLTALGVPEDGGALFELALTHRSYAFELPVPGDHNERLEFLGDAVLGVVVTEFIYREYPELSEGEMARLRASVVNTVALAELARELDLGPHVRLGRGEETTGGRDKDKMLADTFEAIVGAVYIERGGEAVRAALVPLFAERIADSLGTGRRFDAKTALQELSVGRGAKIPAYRVASSGPDHDKLFTAHVYLGDEPYGTGEGRSKKEAEQNAARVALDRMATAPPGADSGVQTERGSDARAS